MLKKAALILTFTLAFNLFFIPGTAADELLNVQNQIIEKQREQSGAESELAKIKQEIASLSSQIGSTSFSLSEINNKVEAINKQIEGLKKELKTNREALVTLEKVRDKQIRGLYKTPEVGAFELLLSSASISTFAETANYQKIIVSDSKDLIAEVNYQITQIEDLSAQLQQSKKELDETAATLRNQLASLQGAYNSALSRQTSVSQQLSQIRSEISRALARKAELAEQQKQGNISGKAPVPVNPGPAGTIYYSFYGRGRYLYQGHGVGLSQYGAQGYARQGKSYSWILKKYYTGVSVSDYTASRSDQGGAYDDSKWKITVSGHGKMTYSQYLAGIGEIPTSWNWKPATYQALITIARTYALNYTGGNPNASICATSSCQVYIGGSAKAAYVTSTRNDVVKSGSSLATTLYSAEHGGHSENNENIFQGWTGSGYQGYPASYLRGVSDAGANFSFPNMGYADWANWTWNTKYSYTIGQIRQILKLSLSSGENSYINSKIGTLKSLSTTKGVSNRIAWVKLIGSKGNVNIPGWVFRAAFNSYDASSVNKDDLMYSMEFSIRTSVK